MLSSATVAANATRAPALAKHTRLPTSDISVAKRRSSSIAYTQYQYGPASDPIMTPAVGGPFTPTQIRAAYGMNTISFGGITGDGTGQTIAIVDAYDNPSFVSSTDPNFNLSDLHRFDFDTTYLGTAGRINVDPPSFTKVNQTGGTSYPAYDSGWAGEIALDVEWAHVMAPKANIVLVEANSAFNSDLTIAVNYAKSIPGVTAVTMSYGTSEYSGEASDDPTYVRSGVSFFASTGDSGSPGSHPAYSANVVAVGGTSLDRSGTVYTETGWSGSGGGISSYISKPTYQQLITTPSSTRRTTPDVSIDANPNTGVYVLDTSAATHANGTLGQAATWYQVGGTSLSSPLWAGLAAVANQGRVLEGFTSFASSQALLTRLYSVPASDYNDILAGVSNGSFSTATGYDLVTGRGSPKAATALHLAGGSVSGSTFIDANGNGTLDGDETGTAGLNLYLDANNNGALDATEATTTTGAGGAYTFADVAGGLSYTVRLVTAAAASYITTTAAGSLVAAVSYGVTTLNIGVFPKSFSGSAFTVRLDATGTIEQVFAAASAIGTPAYSIARSLLGSGALTFAATGGADVYTVDLSNGNPLTTGGITVTGATNADAVNIVGSAVTDTLDVTTNKTAIVGSGTFTYGSVGTVGLTLNGGDDRVDVDSFNGNATLTIDPGAGNDVIALGTATALLDQIFGNVAIPNATSDDAILVNDSNNTLSQTYTIGNSGSTGLLDRAGTFGTLRFGSTTSTSPGPRIDLFAGTSDDTIDITPTAAASFRIFGNALAVADYDTLRVRAAVNSGFTFTQGATSESGSYGFSDGSGPITFDGIEANQPLAVTATYDYASASPAVVVTFTQDVSASLAAGDLVLSNLTTGLPASATLVSYAAATNTATFAVSGLADGNYHATIAASAVGADTGFLGMPVAFDFFVLAGDINHDRVVNFDDLLILAQNYGTAGKTFSQGNLDYSGDGVVNFDDLLILAQKYGNSLAAI